MTIAVITGSLELGNLPSSVMRVNRHGSLRLLPHQIDYLSMLRSLKSMGVRDVIAIHTVGGISERMVPGTVLLPSDVIDYTHGRKGAGYVEEYNPHMSFDEPFNFALRMLLGQIHFKLSHPFEEDGILGVTEGPRLESPAEVRRLQRDGCDVVGMTAMPEAALALCLGLRYASLALVVNRAAGLGQKEQLEEESMRKIRDEVSPRIEVAVRETCNHLLQSRQLQERK